VHEIAAPETGRKQGPGQPPVVGAAAFRLVDRAGRREHALRVAPARCGEAAERPVRLLQVEQLRFACHRNPGERRTRRDGRGIDLGEDARERRRAGLRVRDLSRQPEEQIPLAALGVPRLERVEVTAHPATLASACGGGSA
jgi:hypothetical protein